VKGKWKPTYYGPFQIVEKLSPVVYKVKFPSNARVHENVNVNFIRPFIDSDPSLFPERHPRPLPPVMVEGEEEYVVHDVLDFKLKNNEPYFLTRFEGYPDYQMEWLHYTNFFNEDLTINAHLLTYLQKTPAACTPQLHSLLHKANVPLPKVPQRTRQKPTRYRKQ